MWVDRLFILEVKEVEKPNVCSGKEAELSKTLSSPQHNDDGSNSCKWSSKFFTWKPWNRWYGSKLQCICFGSFSPQIAGSSECGHRTILPAGLAQVLKEEQLARTPYCFLVSKIPKKSTFTFLFLLSQHSQHEESPNTTTTGGHSYRPNIFQSASCISGEQEISKFPA